MALTDIALDPVTHDLLFTDGNLSLLDAGDALAQRIRIRLRSWRGEWYLDSTFGLPYQSEILVKNPDRVLVTSRLRTFIEATPGVKRVVSLSADYDASTRTFAIRDGVVEADAGELVAIGEGS